MQKISTIRAFDVIGPKMIGPSSSHTAGALKMGKLARKLLGNAVLKKVKFTLYGSFAKTHIGHGTDLALIAGVLGLDTCDKNIAHADELASSLGIEIEFTYIDDAVGMHPNTADIELITKDNKHITVRGESIGGGQARIIQIEGTKIEFTGQYNTIVIYNLDHPGVIAHITERLSKEKINIAFMRLYREEKGDMAVTFIECDEIIPAKVANDLKQIKDVKKAIIIEALNQE